MKVSILILTFLIVLCNACVSNKEYHKLLIAKENLERKMNIYQKYINGTAKMNLEKEIQTITCSKPFKYSIDQQFKDIEEGLKKLSELGISANLSPLRMKLSDFKKKHNILAEAKKALSNDYDHAQVGNHIYILELLEGQLGADICDQYILTELKKLLLYLENYCLVYENAFFTFRNMRDYTTEAAVHKDIDLYKKYFKREYPNFNLDDYSFLSQLIEGRYIDYRVKTEYKLKKVNCD